MKPQTKGVLVVACVSFAYVLCAGCTMFWYTSHHPGDLVPRWISVLLLCGLIVTVALGTIVLRRYGKKQVQTETADEGRARRARAIKGLQGGLILWSLILLNDIRMLIQHTVAWTAAIVGLGIVLFLAFATWTSLKKLQKSDAMRAPSGRKQPRQ